MNTRYTGPGRWSQWRRRLREYQRIERAWRTGYWYGRRDGANADAELSEMLDTDIGSQP